MTDLLTDADLAEAEALLAAATPGDWDLVASESWEIMTPDRFDPIAIVYEDGDAALIAAAPSLLSSLIATVRDLRTSLGGAHTEIGRLMDRCGELGEERDRYAAALEAIAPPGTSLQLTFRDEGPCPHMPMYGVVSLTSPPIIANTKNEDGTIDVDVWTYDEDTRHEPELCNVGFFVDEEWLCDRADEMDEMQARAVKAEVERDALTARVREVEALHSDATAYVSVLTSENNTLRERAEAAERERDEARAERDAALASATRGWQTADGFHIDVGQLRDLVAHVYQRASFHLMWAMDSKVADVSVVRRAFDALCERFVEVTSDRDHWRSVAEALTAQRDEVAEMAIEYAGEALAESDDFVKGMRVAFEYLTALEMKAKLDVARATAERDARPAITAEDAGTAWAAYTLRQEAADDAFHRVGDALRTHAARAGKGET